MSSSIFFRFKSQKEPLQITFDGTSLSVFEVKRDIISISKLGDGTDFDLDIYSADGKEKYDDDTTQIPRSTTVIARRQPPIRPGAGRAARYVTGKMPVNAKNVHRIEPTATASTKSTPAMATASSGGKEMTEEEKLQALLSANDQSWKADQETMSHKPVVRSNYQKPAVPDKPLPPGYICHRCGQGGHWIQACPTNNDPTYDNKPKFKRTTGIPRSFLKVVEKPIDVGEDGKLDPSQRPKGVMYTANGEWVIAEPDNATWEKIQEKQNAAAEKAKEAASDEQELRDRGLECSLHHGIFVDPVKTPCCEHTYCNNCIESALLDNDLKCPNCGQQVLLDSLTPDGETTAKIKAYEDEKKAEKLQKQKETSHSPAATAESPKPAEGAVSGTGVADLKPGNIDSAASTPNSKKRSADEELRNDRKPSQPPADMKKTKSNQGTSTTNQSSSAASNPVQAPMATAVDVAEFQKQMQAMSASMNGMQNGMPATNNPMMPNFNPMMMNMGMNMNVPMPMNPAMMGMNMQNFGPGPTNGGNNAGGWNGNTMNQGNWQGGGYGRGGGMQGGGNGNMNSAYMRQPVNPNRHRGRYNRPRSTDYRQI